jgi:hypothetical protein
MKPWLLLVLGASLGAGVVLIPAFVEHVHSPRHDAQRGADVAHTSVTFSFVAKGSMAAVAPLFGAGGERGWAPGWQPDVLWPTDGGDRSGMVFTVAHGHTRAVWVNTRLDLGNGDVQYVYVVPETLATVITIEMRPDHGATHVTVTYDRTALTADANARVLQLAEHDKQAGSEWGHQINSFLAPGSKGA